MRKLFLLLAVVLLLCGCETIQAQPTTVETQKQTEAQVATTTEPEEDRKAITKSLLLSATKDYECKISVYDFGDGLDVTLSFGKTANAWVFYDVTNKATDTCKMLRDQYGYQFKDLYVISGTKEESMLTWHSTDLEIGVMADSKKGNLYKMSLQELKEYLNQ